MKDGFGFVFVFGFWFWFLGGGARRKVQRG